MPRKLKTIEIERMGLEEFREAEKTPLIVVLDNVRSMYNIGSVFRTADAFRIEEILLCGITATPPNNEIHKTALGAEESVRWQYFKETTDAVGYLRDKGCTVCAIEQCEGSVMLNEVQSAECRVQSASLVQSAECRVQSATAQPDSALCTLHSALKIAVILGNEVKGVQQKVIDLADICIEIPQYGTKHSMNVSVTAGIIMWELTKHLCK